LTVTEVSCGNGGKKNGLIFYVTFVISYKIFSRKVLQHYFNISKH